MGIFSRKKSSRSKKKDIVNFINYQLRHMGYDTSHNFLNYDKGEYNVFVDKYKISLKLYKTEDTLYEVDYFTEEYLNKQINFIKNKEEETLRNFKNYYKQQDTLRNFKNKVLTPEGFAELVNEIINKNK